MNITVTSKSIVRLAGFLLGVYFAATANGAAEKPFIRSGPGPFEQSKDNFYLINGRLELEVGTLDGMNPCRLRDLKSGRLYAGGDYQWPGGKLPAMLSKKLSGEKDGSLRVTLRGKLGELEIEQTFFAPAGEPDVLTEVIRIHNPTDHPMDLPSFACGFTRIIHDGTDWDADVAESRFCDVPYRRHPETGELCDFSLQDIAEKPWWFSTWRGAEVANRTASSIRGAEAWAWYDKGNTLLITKYNQDALEWSLIESPPKDKGKTLRFGGAGRWKLGDPEDAARLAPGASFTFGETRYQALDGDWREGYKAFRRFTTSKGHGTPANFNPPVHWNELYDNKLWWIADAGGLNPENLKKYYQFKDMEIEAEKAKEMNCECLYLDPGWDTCFGSNIWDDSRLGKQVDFVRWLKEKYNMKLALHTPLAPWSDPAAYPVEARRMDKAGNRLGELCTSSPAYIETKVARLKELCKNGAYFLMYDGSWFPGECWDKTHGHSLPVTHREHLDAILKIQQKVHEEYPDVLIEQHDPMTGPGMPRYVPTYFMHAKPGAFDELWGFEYMIIPMDDILTRRACSLYYLNLAYGIPVYLHIDLRKDNTNAMMLWWYASTCRHLGFGGKHADPAVWEAQKSAMKTYMKHKRFFTQGVFYGLDETVHVHTLPDVKQAVINVFNLEEKPVRKEIKFRLSEIGLPAVPVEIEGAVFEQKADEIALKLDVPARGHALVKVAAKKDKDIAWNAESGQARLTTGDLELIVETQKGLNPCSLKNVRTGEVYADRDYVWPNGKLPALKNAPIIENKPDGGVSIAFEGKLDTLEIKQTFTAPANERGVILENIEILNPSDVSLATADFKCGFSKCIREGDNFFQDATEIRFCPIPYRRETNAAMQEFPLSEVALHGMTYTGWFEPVIPTPIWGAEGWVWTKGDTSFLLAKHNPDSMEWSLMEPVKQGSETRVRFAGAGQWKHGHPEGATKLEPRKSYRFGETRLQAVSGDWKQAYYAYRGYLDGKGCKTPQGYDPPVHWNELYDNEYYPRVCGLCGEFLNRKEYVFSPQFHEQNKKLLAQYYSLDSMKLEAAKAKELGCESLYMDPGWDTGPSHQVWDTERLGPLDSYVKMIRDDYGLKVSLWCSLAGVPPTYGDPHAVPREARVLDKDGKPAEYLVCFSSPAFLDTKEKLLLDLAKNGAAFFMFDSNQFSGPCYDKSHGHQVPSTREDHARALIELTRRVKSKYPQVLIEMHDFITGPSGTHYTPTYFGYAPPLSFDCLWGHEFMWNSMDDLLSRRAVSLYYYNLAYSIPLYLHVGLKTDNAHALMFWWYASTCRHLGVGGKPADPAVWEAQINAMRQYKKLKRFYTQGVFYGIEETVHAHTLPDEKKAVINLFNLDDKPVERQIRFRLVEIGLPSAPAQIEGASFKQQDGEITLDVAIPARGQILYEIQSK